MNNKWIFNHIENYFQNEYMHISKIYYRSDILIIAEHTISKLPVHDLVPVQV